LLAPADGVTPPPKSRLQRQDCRVPLPESRVRLVPVESSSLRADEPMAP
jgi:hypothetical protein